MCVSATKYMNKNKCLTWILLCFTLILKGILCFMLKKYNIAIRKSCSWSMGRIGNYFAGLLLFELYKQKAVFLGDGLNNLNN